MDILIITILSKYTKLLEKTYSKPDKILQYPTRILIHAVLGF